MLFAGAVKPTSAFNKTNKQQKSHLWSDNLKITNHHTNLTCFHSKMEAFETNNHKYFTPM